MSQVIQGLVGATIGTAVICVGTKESFSISSEIVAHSVSKLSRGAIEKAMTFDYHILSIFIISYTSLRC